MSHKLKPYLLFPASDAAAVRLVIHSVLISYYYANNKQSKTFQQQIENGEYSDSKQFNSDSTFGGAELGETFGVDVSCFQKLRAAFCVDDSQKC